MGSKPVGISASRGAAILGLSDYRTPVQAWLEIMEEMKPGFCAAHGYTTPERTESAPMRFGTAFEDQVITLAENVGAERVKITDREGFYTSPVFDKLTCHIDGIYPDGTLHEGKTTTEMAYRIKWGEEGTPRVPSDYQVQVQHQMICTGSSKALVSVLVFPFGQDDMEKAGWRIDGKSLTDDTDDTVIRDLSASRRTLWAEALSEMGFFHQYPVGAVPESQSAMIEAYRAFWHDHVLKEVPPPVRGYPDVCALFPSPVGTIIATDQVAFWAREYRDIGKEIGKSGSLSKRRDELKTLILDWARNQSEYHIDDDSQEKIVVLDGEGNKLCQYDGKTFR